MAGAWDPVRCGDAGKRREQEQEQERDHEHPRRDAAGGTPTPGREGTSHTV
jgi:hypothetical protein